MISIHDMLRTLKHVAYANSCVHYVKSLKCAIALDFHYMKIWRSLLEKIVPLHIKRSKKNIIINHTIQVGI